MDDVSPEKAWHRLLHEDKGEGMLEMVVGERACGRRMAFPFLLMGSERSSIAFTSIQYTPEIRICVSARVCECV